MVPLPCVPFPNVNEVEQPSWGVGPWIDEGLENVSETSRTVLAVVARLAPIIMLPDSAKVGQPSIERGTGSSDHVPSLGVGDLGVAVLRRSWTGS